MLPEHQLVAFAQDPEKFFLWAWAKANQSDDNIVFRN